MYSFGGSLVGRSAFLPSCLPLPSLPFENACCCRLLWSGRGDMKLSSESPLSVSSRLARCRRRRRRRRSAVSSQKTNSSSVSRRSNFARNGPNGIGWRRKGATIELVDWHFCGGNHVRSFVGLHVASRVKITRRGARTTHSVVGSSFDFTMSK